MVYKEVIQRMINYAAKQRFDRVLGKVKVISAGDGKCDVEMKVEEEHTNVLGTLHGGCTATLVDVISGYALLTHPKLVENIETFPNAGVSVDIHLSYLRAAKIGEEILVKANTVKTGKTLAFLEVSIFNKKTGDILVKGSHTKNVSLFEMVYRELIQKIITNPPGKHFDVFMKKMKILSASNGKCEAEMKVEDEDSNSLGILHTGLITTIVDLIPSYAIITHPIFEDKVENLQFSGPTVALKVSFLQNIMVGEDITVQAETVKTDQTLAYLECRIINKRTNEICVTGTHTKYIADLI